MRDLIYLVASYVTACFLGAIAVILFAAEPTHPHQPEGMNFLIVLLSPIWPYFLAVGLLAGGAAAKPQVVFWTVFLLVMAGSIVFFRRRSQAEPEDEQIEDPRRG